MQRLMQKDVTIYVTNLKSKPYVDLTLTVMREFGLKIPVNHNYESFYFTKENWEKPTGTIEYTVEGDWSGGAFLLVAAAIAGEATIRGLDPQSTQADKAILEALKDAGVFLRIGKQEISVGENRSDKLKAFHF